MKTPRPEYPFQHDTIRMQIVSTLARSTEEIARRAAVRAARQSGRYAFVNASRGDR